ncbi:AI-2E family transporter [Falsiroseomonas oryziterrae]|uniref:AI-2E family transporter n=1 Tax=Falsiroseomonas oryziterrae TaxID=2911368 RepID=UPI001F24CD2A|nr:AI-2E family transporter [Roseomonas sp. NPKOSM-4]
MDQQPGQGVGSLIERGLAIAVVGAVLLGILAVLQPFATAIMFGAILAIALWPLRDALVRRGLRPSLAATVLLLLILAAVVVPVLAIAPGLVEALNTGIVWGHDAMLRAPSTPPDWLAQLPLVGERVAAGWTHVAESRDNLGGLVAPYAARLQSLLLSVAGGLADSLLQLLLALVVAAMFWTTGEEIADSLRHAAGRIGGPTGVNALETAGGAVRSVAYGVVGTSLGQGVLAAIGFAIAGVPAATLLGFLTFVFSISQVLGPLVIVTWAGAAWWLFDSGQTGWAIFMALWGLLAISSSDNVVRPLLIKRGVDMPLSIVILGVFGGFVAFGFLGLFIGPVLLAVGLVMLRAWRAATPADAA